MPSSPVNVPAPALIGAALWALASGCGGWEDSEQRSPFGPIDAVTTSNTTCDPLMSVFPVGDAHNIGYDNSSCGTGTCEISCPDAHANSDYGGDHHGIDVFAYQRAPLVAVVSGQIVAVGTPSDTSGLRVRVRDACGWEYYYGHMDEAVVAVDDVVEAGDLIGYMGYTGTGSTHLHFNVSPDGDYNNDIDPFDLLNNTSATACDDSWEEPAEEDSSSGGGTETGTDTSGGSDTSGSDTSGSDTSGSEEYGCGAVGGTSYLWTNEGLGSCDGRFTLVQQDDGNLVLYQNGVAALWSTETHGYSGAFTAFQDDGNLVVYSSGGSALWSSGTQGHPDAVLVVQDDGNLVIYDGWTALWNSGTCCR
jgi:Peptidase family M23